MKTHKKWAMRAMSPMSDSPVKASVLAWRDGRIYVMAMVNLTPDEAHQLEKNLHKAQAWLAKHSKAGGNHE